MPISVSDSDPWHTVRGDKETETTAPYLDVISDLQIDLGCTYS